MTVPAPAPTRLELAEARLAQLKDRAAAIDARDDNASVVTGGMVDVPVLGNDLAIGDKKIVSVTPGPGMTAANLSIVGAVPNEMVRVSAVGLAAGTYSSATVPRSRPTAPYSIPPMWPCW